MIVNLNARVEVTLTKEGAAIYRDYYKMYDTIVNETEGDIVKEQLWRLMRIFGEDIFVGMKPIFKDNNITIIEDSYV